MVISVSERGMNEKYVFSPMKHVNIFLFKNLIQPTIICVLCESENASYSLPPSYTEAE